MIHRFGLFEFDATAGELRKQGRLVRLEPQPARALALLLANPGEVISRERLKAHLWDEATHVDYDRGLAYCLGQVRAALGDSAENPRFIETLPRRGFRFIAPLRNGADTAAPAELAPAAHPAEPIAATVAAAPPDAAAPSLAASAAGPRRHHLWLTGTLAAVVSTLAIYMAWAYQTPARPIVAVSIFDNETGRPEFDRLAGTAADVMVERLTALGVDRIGVVGNSPALRVPRAARSPEAIRKQTGAGYSVIGQVQDDDAGVRLVVHLIRLDDDTHLWVTRIARAESSLADIQDVAADRLAEAVRRHVIERDPDAPRFTR